MNTNVIGSSGLASAPVELLWMMHVIGPDDIYPAPDYATAVEWCAYLNREIAPKVPGVLCVGVPAIWTGTAEEHAEGLPEAIKGWTQPLTAAPVHEEGGAVLSFVCSNCSVAEPEWCMSAGHCPHRDGPLATREEALAEAGEDDIRRAIKLAIVANVSIGEGRFSGIEAATDRILSALRAQPLGRRPMSAGARLQATLDDFDRENAEDIAAEDFNVGQDELVEVSAADLRALLKAREEAQPTVLPTDETGQITKRFVIFTTPGEVPEKKGGWLKDEHLIDFLRAVMLHDGWKPGFRATVLELTWDNDLWASSASEYLEIHDDAIGPRRARKAWQAARDEHERIYKVAPTMKLGDEIVSYRRITAIAIPEARETEKLRVAVADIAAERQRQVDIERWSEAHDDEHDDHQMARAAGCYAFHAGREYDDEQGMFASAAVHHGWPWDRAWWKPKSRRADLVRAGALIVAEIERLDRQALAALQQEGRA